MALELTEEQVRDGWTIQRLGDLFRVKHGFAFKGKHFSEDLTLPTVVTPGNFAIGGGFKNAKPKTYDSQFPEEYKFNPNDYIVTMTDLSKTGDTLGMPAKIPNDGITYLHNQRIGKIEFKTNRVVKDYIYYKMMTADYHHFLLSTASGSTVRHTSPTKIEQFELVLPPLDEQKRVAEILGSLDDKIEANNALIDFLEQLADAEFLRLLKVHEGSIEDAKYGDLAVFGGGTPSTKKPEYWEGGVINWVTPTDVTGLSNHALFESSRKITDAGLEACSSVLHPAGSILMTSRASIGFFAVNEAPAATNQGFIVVEPENADVRWWVYHHMKRDVGLFLQLSNGATFMELSRGMFKSLPLKLYRGKTVLKDIHAQITSLAAENRELSETRDLLIRKLIM